MFLLLLLLLLDDKVIPTFIGLARPNRSANQTIVISGVCFNLFICAYKISEPRKLVVGKKNGFWYYVTIILYIHIFHNIL